MSRRRIVDLSSLDLEHPKFGIEAIRRRNAQRYEMEQISSVIDVNGKEGWLVGFRDVRADEFWVRGHIPGRPIFPGVLMIETAAQLVSYYVRRGPGGDGGGPTPRPGGGGGGACDTRGCGVDPFRSRPGSPPASCPHRGGVEIRP